MRGANALVDTPSLAGLTDPAPFWAMTVNAHPYVPSERLPPEPLDPLQSSARDISRLTEALIQKFEELTMIHQFADQLHIDADRRTICRDLIEPLLHCIRAKTLAIELYPDSETSNCEVFVTVGESQPTARILRIADAARAMFGDSIAILNRQFIDDDEARRVIVVPIQRADYRAGRIIALGNNEGDEFGTIEADLMRSMAMMLGVHLANQRQFVQIQNTLDGALSALVSALDAKDRYTCGHSTRVAELSLALATDLGMASSEREIVKKSALLHDIGKIGIDDSVLRKPGQLTKEEFDLIKQHPVIGYDILKAIRPFKDLLPGVLHHHEAWNGTGYPHGLVGDAIPRMAQIIAVADSFDAMTSDRPYRDGMSLHRVRQIFKEGSGVQWAPDVSSLLITQIDKMILMLHDGRTPSCS